MDNDKVFVAYALILISGIASVLTASVMAGIASLPSFMVFAEHVVMSLLIRAAYKSFNRFDWSDWNVFGESTGEAITVSGSMLPAGPIADATH